MNQTDRRPDGICNMMSNLCCDIGPDLGESFESTLSMVKQKMDIKKANPVCIKNVILLEMLCNILPYKIAMNLLNKHFSNPPVAFTNIGVLDKNRLIFGSAEMTSAFMTGSIKYVPYFQLSISTFNDEAVLCVNLYGTQSDKLLISRFLNYFIAELEENII